MKPLLALIMVLSLASMSGADTVTIHARYKCDGNKCTLLPAASHPLPVPKVELIPPQQQPTLAEPQGAVEQLAESRPMRSVLVKPVRGAFCAVSKVRQAKPARGLLRRIFCR